jgi:hypothetical protein
VGETDKYIESNWETERECEWKTQEAERGERQSERQSEREVAKKEGKRRGSACRTAPKMWNDMQEIPQNKH